MCSEETINSAGIQDIYLTSQINQREAEVSGRLSTTNHTLTLTRKQYAMPLGI